MFPTVTATIPDKNEPNALDLTENHTTLLAYILSKRGRALT